MFFLVRPVQARPGVYSFFEDNVTCEGGMKCKSFNEINQDVLHIEQG